MSLWLPRRAQAGVAVGLAFGFVALANSAAVADQVRSQEWWLRTLHVTQAWESSHGSGVTVAVLDTGVAASQPDLSGSVTSGPDFTQSGRTAGSPFWGIHGTEVASLIAGHGHGPGHTEGIVGIAPAAKILSVRVTLESNDPLLTDATVAAGLPNAIARGITYAVRHGANVIDLPLDPVTTPGATGAGGSPAERSAVARALAHHVVLVAPAGDNGAGADAVNYPAAYRGVISVGAFDSRFYKATFTSHQPYVTLTAAGVGMIAADPAHGYKTINSTSAASAVVAGIVALIKAQFPAMTPAQVTSALIHSTAYQPKDGRLTGSGYGTVDAASALMTAAKMANAVPKTADSAGGQPPSAPAVHPRVASQHLTRTLVVDAGIAAVVFLVLLGLILAIRALQRRRARSARLAEVRAAAQIQRPAEPAMPASTPAGFMAAPHARPIPGMPAAGSVPGAGSLPGAVASRISGTAAESRFGGTGGPGSTPAGSTPPLPFGHPDARPAGLGTEPTADAPHGLTRSGLPRRVQPQAAFPQSAFPGTASPESTFPGSGSHGSAFPPVFPDAVSRGEAAVQPSPPAADEAAGPGANPRAFGSHRMGMVRRPPVSGNPPWEPADRPDSELPWNQAPAPQAGGTRLPQRRASYSDGVPSWDAIAEEVWPGGPRVAGPHPPAPAASEPDARETPGRRGRGPWPDAPPAPEQSQRDRPIYVWNPEPGSSGRPGQPADTRSTPPWESSAPDPSPDDSAGGSAPPWEEIDSPRSGPAGSGSFGALSHDRSDDVSPAAPAAAGGAGRSLPSARPSETPNTFQPEETGGLGSSYLPAAPAGANGSYPAAAAGGTANSYLWAPSDRTGSSYPAAAAGQDTGSFESTLTGESTETFTAVSPRGSDPSHWRLSLPTESTETFPAVPRSESSETREDD